MSQRKIYNTKDIFYLFREISRDLNIKGTDYLEVSWTRRDLTVSASSTLPSASSTLPEIKNEST